MAGTGGVPGSGGVGAPPSPSVDPSTLVPHPRLIRASLLSPNEQMLHETRPTRWHFLPGPIFLLLVFLLLGYASYAAQAGWTAFPYLTDWFSKLPTSPLPFLKYLTLLFWVLALVTFLWFSVRYIRWIRTVYAVTTSRIIVQTGILTRDFDEIPVNKVRAIDVRQSILQRILGYGTIKVTSESVSRIANEDWVGIPRPWEIQRLVNAAAERYGR